MDAIGFETHDHNCCISDAVAMAEARCADAGLMFTPVRRRVLELLLSQHRAMGAYDILDHLRDEGLGSQPPIAYRALDFLVSNGFAHKIERLNAFIACCHPGACHSPAFLICTSCSSVAEALSEQTPAVLNDMAQAAGFTLDCAVIEAEGVCPNCQGKDPA